MVSETPFGHGLRQILFGGPSGGVFRGMLTLALGSAVGRLISLLSIPVLTRLYTPEDFGVLAVFTALIAILTPLVTLRYVLALPLPRHDGAAMNLLVLSVLLMLGLTGIMTLVLWMYGPRLLSLMSMDVLTRHWWLIALGVFGAASYEIMTMWATRKRSYRIIAQTSVTQSISGMLVKMGMALFSTLQPIGLLVGQVVTQTSGISRLMSGHGAELGSNWRRVSGTRMRRMAWLYRGFPIWRMPSQLLMVYSIQAPMLLMASLYNAETTGQFGLAVMSISLPVTLLGHSAGRALFGEASVVMKSAPERVLAMCLETQFRLFLISFLPAALFFFFGDKVFVLIFGAEWRNAGEFTSILSISMIFQFTSAPLMQVMNLLARQSTFLIINIIRVVGVILVFLLSHTLAFDAYSAVLFYSLYSAAFYISVSVFTLKVLKRASE